MRKFLVVVRAGDESLHETWLSGGADRNWDLIVSYYGKDPDRFRDGCESRVDGAGPKFPALSALLVEQGELIASYDFVLFPDDDLAADTETINRYFEICATYGLELSQPALTGKSYFTHAVTMANERFLLRYTNFVEIMVPCFSRAFLKRCAPTFKESTSGWGLDCLWSTLVSAPSRIAIVDAAPVHHTRPIGGPTHSFFAKMGIDLHQELDDFLKKYNLSWRNYISLGGITTDEVEYWIDTNRHGDFIIELINGYMSLFRTGRFNFMPLVQESIKSIPPFSFRD